jgi:hypothetical protein
MKGIKTEKLLLIGAAGFAVYWLFLRKAGASTGNAYFTTTPESFWDRYFPIDWTQA